MPNRSSMLNIITMHAGERLKEELEDDRIAQRKARTQAHLLDICQEIRDCLDSQEDYDTWWNSAPANDFYNAAVDKLLELHLPRSPWTSYAPSDGELSKRSYNGRLVAGLKCPRCNHPLIVNEKSYKTTDPSAPHYERRLVCSGFFTIGCSYKEPWSDEIQVILNQPIEIDVDF